MANDDYQALRIAINRGVAFVTIDNGPINLLDLTLIGDLDRAGRELVLACDMRFAAIGKAVLGQPELGIGLVPGGGGSVRRPRLVGRGDASPRGWPAACRRPPSRDAASTTSGARLRTVMGKPDDEIHAHVCRRTG
jgi:hypothetical protein